MLVGGTYLGELCGARRHSEGQGDPGRDPLSVGGFPRGGIISLFLYTALALWDPKKDKSRLVKEMIYAWHAMACIEEKVTQI